MLDCDRVFRDCTCISTCSPPIPQPAPHLAHQAAEDVFRHPISRSLESLRRQQRKPIYTKRVSRVRLPSGKVSRSRTTAASVGRSTRPILKTTAQERELERLRKLVASDALQPLTPNPRRPNRPSIQRTPPAWYVAMYDPAMAGSSSPKSRGILARPQPDFAGPSQPTRTRNAYTSPIVGPSGSPIRSKPNCAQVKRQTLTSGPDQPQEVPIMAMSHPAHSFHHRASGGAHEKRFGVADPQL